MVAARRLLQSGIPSRIWTLQDYVSVVDMLRTPSGMRGSNGKLLGAGIFGRDNAQIGLDLVLWYRKLAEFIAYCLARYQGLEEDPFTEEGFGRIIHELRLKDLGLGPIDHEQLALLRLLQQQWGRPCWLRQDGCCYYGSIDATYMYLSLLAQLGPTFLEQEFRHASGRLLTFRQSAVAAMEWGLRQIDSITGLILFQRTNPNGHPFPVTRDGLTPYVDVTGKIANHRRPVAALDAQGIGLRGLEDAAALLGADAPASLHDVCSRLRNETLTRFWLPEAGTFAMALYQSPEGAWQQMKTLSSVGAEMMELGLFKGLTQNEQAYYISHMLRLMYGEDFCTPVGLRMRGLRHAYLVPYIDYQGSFVSWPVINSRFIQGLIQLGSELADDMAIRMLNAHQLSGVPWEYYIVLEGDRVHYDPLEEYPILHRERLVSTPTPEPYQGWTVSAAVRALHQLGVRHIQPAGWVRELSRELLANTKLVRLYTSEAELMEAFPVEYGYHIDREAGFQTEMEFKLLADRE